MRTKVPPHIMREILRLYYQENLSIRNIANSFDLHRDTISRIIRHFDNICIDIKALNTLSDEQLYQHLKLSNDSAFRTKPYPDWNWVHSEMRHSQMTLETLWREWKETEPEGIAYTQFAKKYRAFKNGLPTVMRQIHIPGEKLFLDFAGKSIPVYVDGADKPCKAQIFVAVLGYSNYSFACAVWKQSTENWLNCHVRAFNFFEGVPKFLIPDNLKAAVIKHRKYFVELNFQYQQLAQHYNTIVLPARPRKPKDKAKAETGVKLIQRWLLNALRYQKFFSLDELNEAISKQLFHFNQRAFKKLPKESRQSLFARTEKQSLTSLPERAYEHAEWQFHVKVKSDYMVEFCGHYYSVPYRYIHQQVAIRGTERTVEIFHNRLRICSHTRSNEVGISMIDEHRPPNHKHYADNKPDKLLVWAESAGKAIYEHVKHHLMQRKDVANGHKAAYAIRKASEAYGDKHLEEACAYALHIGTKDLNRLRSILKEKPYQHPALNASEQRSIEHKNLRGAEYFAKQGGY